MVSHKDKIQAEMANIEKILEELIKVKDRKPKEAVVLAGIGGFLASIYNGMENILKQLVTSRGISLPQGPTWYKDLLNLSIEQGFITAATGENIGRYLFIRHFYSHGYGFQIDEAKLMPLVHRILDDYLAFKKEVGKFL